jgi:branched-chain amino acid aminotransferase
LLKTVTTINGRFRNRKDARISVFDNALLYAEGLFETLLAVNDRIIFRKEHLNRLYRGARVIGLNIPVTTERLSVWMKKTVRAHPDRITKLRLTVTSGEASRWVGRQGKPQVILSASPHTMPERPFRIQVSRFRVDHKSVFRRIKTLSYVIHAAALQQARRAGCDDALLLNQNDKVAEVTSANVFWVKSGRIFTPPISSGCLEGITRKIVIKEARRIGHAIAEKNCSLSQLLQSDELFISSSLKLVVGVSMVKVGRKSYKLPTGPITADLANQFYRLVSLD